MLCKHHPTISAAAYRRLINAGALDFMMYWAISNRCSMVAPRSAVACRLSSVSAGSCAITAARRRIPSQGSAISWISRRSWVDCDLGQERLCRNATFDDVWRGRCLDDAILVPKSVFRTARDDRVINRGATGPTRSASARRCLFRCYSNP